MSTVKFIRAGDNTTPQSATNWRVLKEENPPKLERVNLLAIADGELKIFPARFLSEGDWDTLDLPPTQDFYELAWCPIQDGHY